MKQSKGKEQSSNPKRRPIQLKKTEQEVDFKDSRPQSNQQLQRQAIADTAVSSPLVNPNSGIAQLHPRAVVQLNRKKKKKNKKGGKMREGMAKAKPLKSSKAGKQSQAARSFNNLQAYRSGWIKRNDITAATVGAFLKTYKVGKIRGHASGDNSKGEQGNTTTDVNAYRSWHRGKYGWR